MPPARLDGEGGVSRRDAAGLQQGHIFAQGGILYALQFRVTEYTGSAFEGFPIVQHGPGSMVDGDFLQVPLDVLVEGGLPLGFASGGFSDLLLGLFTGLGFFPGQHFAALAGGFKLAHKPRHVALHGLPAPSLRRGVRRGVRGQGLAGQRVPPSGDLDLIGDDLASLVLPGGYACHDLAPFDAMAAEGLTFGGFAPIVLLCYLSRSLKFQYLTGVLNACLTCCITGILLCI